MRIAQLAPLTESVPPSTYGGTELVVSLLTEELSCRGHQVTLIASGDSVTSARLIAPCQKALRLDREVPQTRWQAYDLCALLMMSEMRKEFDIIHNHMGYQALPWLDRIGCPVLTTNHNPIKAYNAPIYLAFKHLPYVSISNAYRQFNYGSEMNYYATVYNGIEIEIEPASGRSPRSYLLFLGRICRDKGTSQAIEIADRLGLPLKIAGKVDQTDEKYFLHQVKPHLTSPDIEFLGEVNSKQKRALYQQAIAVLYPIGFEEPFGLVMAEALSCGTPVMAFNRGSVPEVLSDDTAIIGDTVDDLVSRFPELKRISATACRDRATRLFGKERMTDDYERVYREICQRFR